MGVKDCCQPLDTRMESCEGRRLMAVYSIPDVPVDAFYQHEYIRVLDYDEGHTGYQLSRDIHTQAPEIPWEDDVTSIPYDELDVNGSAGDETLELNFTYSAISRYTKYGDYLTTVRFGVPSGNGTAMFNNKLVIVVDEDNIVTAEPGRIVVDAVRDPFATPPARPTTVLYDASVTQVEIVNVPEPAAAGGAIVAGVAALGGRRRGVERLRCASIPSEAVVK